MHSTRRSQDDRDTMITDHLHLVTHVVNQLSVRYPRHVDRQELWNAGALGLVDAARRYDPDAGLTFPRYAMIRIRGAIIDSTRTRDWATRSVRRGMRELREASERFRNRHRREPSSQELADSMGVSVEQLASTRADAASAKLLYLDRRLGPHQDDASLADLVEERDADVLPDRKLEQRELVGTLRTAVAALPEVQREVVRRSYLAGEYLRDIAASLGVTEARVSQIRAEALDALRAYFGETYDGVPAVDSSAPGTRSRSAFVAALKSDSTWRARLAAADREAVPAARSA